MIVELFSADMVVKVCKYLNCNACGDSQMTSDASFNARAAFISPSAAITCKQEDKKIKKGLKYLAATFTKLPRN